MKKLNYGIISAATIAPRFVAALNTTKHSRALAIGASSLNRAKQFAKDYDIAKAYGSYKEVYEDPEIDVVYIASINDQHFTQIMEALSHKKHVICEKPMVLNLKDAQEAFAFARQQGVFLMEAQKTVFLPTSQFVKDKILDKDFGELKHINLSASWLIDFPKKHWVYDHHQAGVLFSSASYLIEYLLYLLDNPQFEYVTQMHLGTKTEIDDILISFKFNNKLLASTHLTMTAKTNNEAIFYFEKAIITIKKFWSANQLVVYTHSCDEYQTISYEKVPEMVYEIEHVYDCITKGLHQSPIMTEEITTTCVSLVEEIYKSTQK